MRRALSALPGTTPLGSAVCSAGTGATRPHMPPSARKTEPLQQSGRIPWSAPRVDFWATGGVHRASPSGHDRRPSASTPNLAVQGAIQLAAATPELASTPPGTEAIPEVVGMCTDAAAIPPASASRIGPQRQAAGRSLRRSEGSWAPDRRSGYLVRMVPRARRQ